MILRLKSWRVPISRPLLLCLCGFLIGLFVNLALLNARTLYRVLDCGNRSLKHGYQRRSPPKSPLLLVGVMTASKYVDSRAWTVWRTWASSIPGKLLFFVAQDTVSRHEEKMPLIHLKGVDDAAYPPQKKSFSMLRWMYDNELNNYDWFMRADDDLYVRSDKLETFLRSLDANKAHMIGQAGLGNTAEYGQLSLGPKDNYCMGGPGVIFSREALRILGPHLEECLQELLTSHEDVELGRCVRKNVGIACTWSYEMQTLFHNNQSKGVNAIPQQKQGLVVPENFRKTVTLHPVKNPGMLSKIHQHNLFLKLNELRERKIQFLKELEPQTESNPLVREATNTTDHLRHWDFISGNKITFCADQVNCPRHTIDAGMKRAINQIVVKLFDQFNSNARQRGRTLQFQNIQYGYSRVEPLHGVDYILDIVLWFKRFRPPNRATISVRRHAYVQQTFGPLQAQSDEEFRTQITQHSSLHQAQSLFESKNESGFNARSDARIDPSQETIHIIVALQGRAETFKRFAENLRKILPARENNVELIVVHYRSQNASDDTSIQNTVEGLSTTIPVKVVSMGERHFSRGRALAKGSASTQDSNSLLFFTDVDMLFDYETLERIRLNTILGAQVYFPITFSEYFNEYWNLPGVDESVRTYEDSRGYFRHFGFGLVSIYKSDFDQVGGFNLSINGWGLEDVDLFEKCIHSPNLRVFRAPEPGLVHVFHPIHCDPALPAAQWKMCIGTMAASLASFNFLADQISPNL